MAIDVVIQQLTVKEFLQLHLQKTSWKLEVESETMAIIFVLLVLGLLSQLITNICSQVSHSEG